MFGANVLGIDAADLLLSPVEEGEKDWADGPTFFGERVIDAGREFFVVAPVDEAVRFKPLQAVGEDVGDMPEQLSRMSL